MITIESDPLFSEASVVSRIQNLWMQLQAAYAVQLIGTRDLAVHDTVAVVFAGILRKRRLNGVENQIQTRVPDGVDRNLHPVGMGIADQLVHLFSAE